MAQAKAVYGKLSSHNNNEINELKKNMIRFTNDCAKEGENMDSDILKNNPLTEEEIEYCREKTCSRETLFKRGNSRNNKYI